MPERLLLGGLRQQARDPFRDRDPFERAFRRLGAQPRGGRAQLPRSVIERTAREEGPGILASIGSALAIPGDYARGAIKSLLTESGGLGERVTARELLDALGIEPEAEFDITDPFSAGGLNRLGAGLGVLGTDILTDPTTLLAGIGQLGKGAKAVSEATKAVQGARDLSQLSRRLLPRTRTTRALPPGGPGLTTAPPDVARVVGARRAPASEEIFRRGGLLSDVRPEISSMIRQQRSRARELLEELPERLRPAELFRGGRPQLQRLAGRRALPARRPGQGRELLTVGLPFTRARGRLPVLPQRLEELALNPVERGLGALGRGIRRRVGRGIPVQTRSIFRFLGAGTKKTAEVIGTEIGRHADELVAKRVVAAGGSADDIADEVRREFNVDVRNAREGVPTRANTEEILFGRDLNTIVDGITSSQIATGARNDALIEDYAERILTPFAREMLRQKRLSEPFRRFMNDRARIYEGSQVRRKDYLREKLTTDANEFFRQKFPQFEGQDWFDLNPARTVEIAVRDRSMSVLQANLVTSLVRNFGGMAGRAGDVPIANFFADVSLKSYGGARWSKNNVGEIENALTEAGIDIGTTVPLEIVKDVKDVLGTLANTTQGAWRDFLERVWDPINSMYRLGATIPFPGFHVRNLGSDITLSAMDGVRNPRYYMQSLRTMIGGQGSEEMLRLERLGVSNVGWTKQGIEEAKGTGVFGDSYMQQLQRWVTAPPAGKRTIAAPLLWWTRSMGKLGTWIENFSRVAHYYGKKAQGATDIEALGAVNKYHFNYGREALSPIERGLANRVYFFWRWQRYALPLMLGQLFEHPARFSVLGRITTQPGVERPAGIPEFVRESAGVPGRIDPETGEQKFTTRFGSPFETFDVLEAFGGPFGTASEPGFIGGTTEFLREVTSDFVPPLRALMELIAGQEFFLERDIEELQRGSRFGAMVGGAVSQVPGLEGIGAMIGEEVPTRKPGVKQFRRSPALRFAARNLPTSRATQTLSRLADAIMETVDPSPTERRRMLSPELLRTFAGIGFADVDTAREAVNRARRVLSRRADELGLQGLSGRLKIPFMTEKGKQDPETREVFELMNRLRGRERL